MARRNVDALAQELFERLLAPLVLGGTITLGRPVGAVPIEEWGDDRGLADVGLASAVQVARVRTIRALCPVDTVARAPSAAEWALAAVVHDLIQATHPDFDALFRRGAPERLLAWADASLARVGGPRDLHDALSRHSLFSRLLQITRTDVTLRWWTGSRRFLGAEAPPRLKALPDLRRVTEERNARALLDLPRFGAAVSSERFDRTVSAVLRATPLTDLSSLEREQPAFTFHPGLLALLATRGGRTLAVRALLRQRESVVLVALGGAAQALVAERRHRELAGAADLLAEYVLALASARHSQPERTPLTMPSGPKAALALAMGATAARQWIAERGDALREPERRSLLELLAPAADSPAAASLRAALDS